MNASEQRRYRQIGTRPPRPDGADKVTGKARYGADYTAPGMVWGAVLRSPHAHALIRAIDTTAASRIPGVLAIVTAKDLRDLPADMLAGGEGSLNLRDLARNVLAHDKVLYHGHAVAAIAATSRRLAQEALAAIEVDYEPLRPVLDLDSAMAANAPILHQDQFTQGLEVDPTQPSNVASRIEFSMGDVEQGFAAADLVREGTYSSGMSHQGYIEPHAVLASVSASGQVDIWVTTQGPFVVRNCVAALLGIDQADIRVIPTEIGGGFGGKTTVYLEPLAVALSRKCGRPVKMQMSREEVMRATGPGSPARVRVRIGARSDGTITAMDAHLEYEAGAFKGSPFDAAAMVMFACYDVPNQRVIGYDVVVNKPKACAYRAPGAPQAFLATENVIDDLARALDMDPIEMRLRNAARKGTRNIYGMVLDEVGFVQCLERAQAHPHYHAALGPNRGRGIAAGYWFNGGLQSCAQVHLTENGKLLLEEGNPDIGGSRASMALIAAETLGVRYEDVKPVVVDTANLPYSDLTAGSRVTYTTGYAVLEACRNLIEKLRARAATAWDVGVSAVQWCDGHAIHAGKRLSLAELAAMSAHLDGSLSGEGKVNLKSVAPAFTVNIADVEVDPETGRTRLTRFTSIQDVGRAVHPDFVEGQLQGGAAQGIGWALNEEFRFDARGVMENPGFLDYRMPVASDLPMIDTVLVEVPHPDHPLGIRGVGEAPICAPMAAILSAVNRATGLALREVPLSPTRVLEALLRRA